MQYLPLKMGQRHSQDGSTYSWFQLHHFVYICRGAQYPKSCLGGVFNSTLGQLRRCDKNRNNPILCHTAQGGQGKYCFVSLSLVLWRMLRQWKHGFNTTGKSVLPWRDLQANLVFLSRPPRRRGDGGRRPPTLGRVRRSSACFRCRREVRIPDRRRKKSGGSGPSPIGGTKLRCEGRKTANEVLRQGILKGEVSLYHWPPVWLVWNQLYDNWQFLFLFAKQANPNRSNRRSMVQWYFPFSIPWLRILSRGQSYKTSYGRELQIYVIS